MDHDWPDNVSELENSIEHAFVVCNKKLIDIFDLPQDIRHVAFNKEHNKTNSFPTIPVHYLSENTSLSNQLSFRIITKEKLNDNLSANQFNRKQTAKTLGISIVALWKKMKKLGIIN